MLFTYHFRLLSLAEAVIHTMKRYTLVILLLPFLGSVSSFSPIATQDTYVSYNYYSYHSYISLLCSTVGALSQEVPGYQLQPSHHTAMLKAIGAACLICVGATGIYIVV